jgi:hypothetical protein
MFEALLRAHLAALQITNGTRDAEKLVLRHQLDILRRLDPRLVIGKISKRALREKYKDAADQIPRVR